MKKSMKAKTPAMEPVGHPPVLDDKTDLPKLPTHTPERYKRIGRKGQKGSR